MAYEKQQWDTTSYINPTRMNHIEDGIKANSNEIESVANNVIAYGECTTARSTVAKVVSCSGFVLKKGSRIAIRFTDTGNSNPSSGNLTLNVNGTGAKTIVDGHANKTILTYANGSYFYNNLVAEFVYDGTYWVYMNRDANTTYTGATLKTGAAKTGSGTTVTDTIEKSTTIDNAIQTLLNNDVAINSNLDNTNHRFDWLYIEEGNTINLDECNEIQLIPYGNNICVQGTFPAHYIMSLANNSKIVLGGYTTSLAYAGAHINVIKPTKNTVQFELLYFYNEDGVIDTNVLNIYAR